MSEDDAISANIDRYVSGIYIQRSTDNGESKPNQYYKAVDCKTLHPDYS